MGGGGATMFPLHIKVGSTGILRIIFSRERRQKSCYFSVKFITGHWPEWSPRLHQIWYSDVSDLYMRRTVPAPLQVVSLEVGERIMFQESR